MTSFSIDEVRESFTVDLTNFLSQIEAAARDAALAPALVDSPPGEAAGPSSFDAIRHSGHSIGGTSNLVGAASLAGSAGLLEELAEYGRDAVRQCRAYAARARQCSALCLEGALAMRSMLVLELDHRSTDAGWIATEWEQRVAEHRPRLAGALDPVGAADRAADVDADAPHPAEPGREFAFDDEEEVGRRGARGASDESMSGELKEIFQQEAREALVALDGLLAALAADPTSRALAGHIERIFHTLKGASATVGLVEVSELAKELQVRMELVVDGGETVTPAFVDQLFADTNRVLAAAGLPGLLDPASRSQAAQPAAESAELRAPFLAEARRICEDAMAHLRQIADGPRARQAAARADLSRLFHRLKGSALVIGDEPAAAKAAELEALCAGNPPAATAIEPKLAELAAHLGIALVAELGRSPRAVSVPAPRQDALAEDLEAVEIPEPEVWEAFVQESGEILDEIEKLALDLERSDQPKRLVEEALRLIHTLKGAVNTVGLAPTGDALHAAEDFLTELCARPILPAPRAIAGFLLELPIQVRKNVERAPSGEIDAWVGKVDGWVARVAAGDANPDELSVGSASPGGEAGETGASGSAASAGNGASTGRSGARDLAAPPEVERRYIRVPADRLDSLMNLVGELVVSRSRLLSRVSVLRSLQLDLGQSRARLVDTVHRFCDQYEFANLGGQRLPSRPAGFGVPRAAEVPRVARRTAGGEVGADGEAAGLGHELTSFSELELDRYEDVHILARSLSEIQDDVHEVDVDLVRELGDFAADAESFGGIVSRIQGEVTRARMVSLESLFTRLRLPVRDAAEKSRKDVSLATVGEDVTLDKTIADALFTPMLHLVRNAVAHGIETPARREGLGKRREGRIVLSARQESGQIVIEIRDDGQGLDLAALAARGIAMGLIARDTPLEDPAVKDLVFAAGLSTQAAAGMVSGRGIGCDVVKRAIERMNGDVVVTTRPGVGTTFTLTLPVTLAITRAILVQHGGSSFAFPMYFADRIIQTDEQAIVESAGNRRLSVDGSFVPLRRFEELFGRPRIETGGPAIVLRVGDQSVAIQVDAVVGQAEIVVKRLGEILDGHPLFGGMTIRGTGDLSLIVDVPGLIDAVGGKTAFRPPRRAEVPAPSPIVAEERVVAPVRSAAGPDSALWGPPRPRVLFVDDSLSVRKVAERVLAGLGVEVTVAMDGVDALTKLRAAHYDVVFTDLEMPRMHGYDLIREIRYIPSYRHLPIAVVSSRSGQKHRDQARALGATAYITKPFTPEMLKSILDQSAADRVDDSPTENRGRSPEPEAPA